MQLPPQPPHSQAAAQNKGYLALAVGIVLLAFTIRVIALFSLPLFIDEAAHIYRAFQVQAGKLFPGLEHQKWLYTVVLAAFRPDGPESVWLARTLSALLSTITVAAAIALARLLTRRAGCHTLAPWAGLAAGLIYALLPMAVFHERQALVDPMQAAFAAVATLTMIRLVRRPTLPLAALLTLCLAGAVLTKTSSLVYLPLPIAAAVLLARRSTFWRSLELGAASGLTAWASLRIVTRIAEQSGAILRASHRPSLDNTLLTSLSSPETQAMLRAHLGNIVEALVGYVGWAVLGLAALALLWLLQSRAWRESLFLALPALAFILPLVIFKQVTGRGYVPPRYLLPNTLPLVALAACSLTLLIDRLRRFSPAAAGGAGAALLAATLLPALRFDARLICNPAETPFTSVDYNQYLENYNGFATQQAARALIDAWRAGGEQHIGIMGFGAEISALNSYLGPRAAVFADLTARETDPQGILSQWLISESQVFIVDRLDYGAVSGMNVAVAESIGVYEGLDVLRVTGAEGELADQVYVRLAGEPLFMAADYEALAATLAQETAPRSIVVFPPTHAPELSRYTPLDVRPLPLHTWPLTPDAAQTALRALHLDQDGSPVEVVFAAEPATDPAHTLALAFQHSLYNTGAETWHGSLHRRRFLTGPPNPPLTPRATFEDALHLSAALLDDHTQPGDAVRLALAWQTDQPVQDSFKVFAHLVTQDGSLLAQHDAFPGAGLLPMTAWTPGLPVPDHLAIVLPPDAPPGLYELRVGIYHPVSGLRLRVTQGSPAPDYVILGQVTVAPLAGQTTE